MIQNRLQCFRNSVHLSTFLGNSVEKYSPLASQSYPITQRRNQSLPRFTIACYPPIWHIRLKQPAHSEQSPASWKPRVDQLLPSDLDNNLNIHAPIRPILHESREPVFKKQLSFPSLRNSCILLNSVGLLRSAGPLIIQGRHRFEVSASEIRFFQAAATHEYGCRNSGGGV